VIDLRRLKHVIVLRRRFSIVEVYVEDSYSDLCGVDYGDNVFYVVLPVPLLF
jgi:hypothetical protein